MELPDAVPVMTLPSATLFPQALLPLYIFEPRYRRMLADMLRSDRMFSVAMQQPGKQRELPCPVAGLGLIRVSVGYQDGTSRLILQGLTRVELVKTVQTKPYRIASIRPLQSAPRTGSSIQALVAKVHSLVEERIGLGSFPLPFSAFQNSAAFPGKSGGSGKTQFSPKEILDYLESLQDPDQLADLVSCALLPGALERQKILATVDLEERLRCLVHFLMAEINRAREDGAS
jgi:Lon protease-like protein